MGEEAYNTYQQFKQLGFEPTVDIYNTMIKATGRGKLVDKSFEIFEEMIASTQQIACVCTRLNPHTHTYQIAFHLLCGLLALWSMRVHTATP